jgi:hypothetical protein
MSLRSSGLRPHFRILATAFARGLQIRSALKKERAQATLKERARQSQLKRPSLPDPRFVTNAHTPLWWDGMA